MMSTSTTLLGGFGYGFVFYKLFALAFLIGLIFLIAWAIKNLKKDQLRKWGIVLLVVGLLGLLLAASSGYGAHRFSKSGKFGFGQNMFGCMQDEECHEEMESLMDRMMGDEEESAS